MKTPPTPHAPAPNRLFALDLLRTLACFLVIWQHVIEPYYAYPDLTIVRNADTPIVGWINSLTPIEVPLFVMISGYFLLPLREKTSIFSDGVSPAFSSLSSAGASSMPFITCSSGAIRGRNVC